MLGILGNHKGQVSTGYENLVYCRTQSIDKVWRVSTVFNSCVPNVYGLAVDVSGNYIVNGLYDFTGKQVVNINNKELSSESKANP